MGSDGNGSGATWVYIEGEEYPLFVSGAYSTGSKYKS